MEGNVQQLLAAERKANEIIENAQQKKTTLMKEAKFHATQEIEKFKQSEEKRYNDELEKRWGARNDLEEMERESAREIKSIKEEYEENKDKVIALLLANVKAVNLEIPDVVKGVFN